MLQFLWYEDPVGLYYLTAVKNMLKTAIFAKYAFTQPLDSKTLFALLALEAIISLLQNRFFMVVKYLQ